mmetsp:Transcript_42397/g.86679  ORF Transcript_42397/g.86679 Transcript_42397/m.86679 type:complete len:212 (-) Transcript_42397:522-1157(-)
MLTCPLSGSSASMSVSCAAAIAASENLAILMAWSACWSSTRLVTAMYASPMVSTLNTPCWRDRSSNVVYSRSSMFDTFSGATVEEILVKPTMSEKKMVTTSLCSGSILRPSDSASAMCLGNTSYSRSLMLFCLRLSWLCTVLSGCAVLGSNVLRRLSISWKRGRTVLSACQHSLSMTTNSGGMCGGISQRFGGLRSRSWIAKRTSRGSSPS